MDRESRVVEEGVADGSLRLVGRIRRAEELGLDRVGSLVIVTRALSGQEGRWRLDRGRGEGGRPAGAQNRLPVGEGLRACGIS